MMEARLYQAEEQLAQVSDAAAEGADGVLMVDALQPEMQRLRRPCGRHHASRWRHLRLPAIAVEQIALSLAQRFRLSSWF